MSTAVTLSVTQPVGAQVKQPTATGTGGAIATVEVLASEAGLEVLRAGGNAVDAAVAAAAVLGVTEPFSSGLGGGGFMVIRTADGPVTTIDHRETAPAAMHPESFFEGGAPLGFTEARYSGLSAGVPGTVRGWADALAKYGTMSLAGVLQPAIGVARQGFQVDQVFHDQVQGNVDFFDDITSSQALYLRPRRHPARRGHPRSPIRTWPERTSGSPTSAPRGSTGVPSPTPWSRRCRARRSTTTPTTCGGPA